VAPASAVSITSAGSTGGLAPEHEAAPPVVWAHEAAAELEESGARAEEQLAELAAAVGPLRRVLAAIAARWVATRAFERLGYARASDCSRERAGLSARKIQELARVHRALASLPALERALVSNVLPWCA